MITMSEASRLLAAWGLFVANRGATEGWPSQSPTARLKNVGRSDKYLFDNSVNITFPNYLSRVAETVDAMELNQKLAVRVRYTIAGDEQERRIIAARFGFSWRGYTASLHSAKAFLCASL